MLLNQEAPPQVLSRPHTGERFLGSPAARGQRDGQESKHQSRGRGFGQMKSSRKCLRVVSELPAAAETWAEGLGASWILSRRPASPSLRLFGGREERKREARSCS